ncbi:MAG TPA: hypothetical protein VEZ90_17140 [Blastocatellia bacterium]|nr:hypothetical protein [Blastocatellia bacterium]
MARKFLDVAQMSSDQATVNIAAERNIAEIKAVSRRPLLLRISALAGSSARALLVALILAAATTLVVTGDASRLCAFLTKPEAGPVDSAVPSETPREGKSEPQAVPSTSNKALRNCGLKSDQGACPSHSRKSKKRVDVRSGYEARNNWKCPLEGLTTKVTVSVQGQSVPLTAFVIRSLQRAGN